ncbi:MAG: hypothetical protein HYW78_03940 [Parcubacteria group bacterium]|nr:hypothetical protein [Parcubacteria group bacterium]
MRIVSRRSKIVLTVSATVVFIEVVAFFITRDWIIGLVGLSGMAGLGVIVIVMSLFDKNFLWLEKREAK